MSSYEICVHKRVKDMADQERLDMLKQGVESWNTWRSENPNLQPDLSKADLRATDISTTKFEEDPNMVGFTWWTTLDAKVTDAEFQAISTKTAHNQKTTKQNTDQPTVATTIYLNLKGANLSKANLCGANLSGCHIYAISAWNVRLEETIQTNLIITRYKEPTITVDNIEVAQFIYLLLNNERIRDLIDNITSKVVLILGRFTPKQKLVLDVLRGELRNQNYTPVIFDFEKPATRDLTETVITLAHLARFIIVDLTDPSSAPHEVAMVIPHTVVPVQPLLSQEPLLIDGKSVERREYAMFEDLRRRYHWVLPTLRYQDKDELLALLQTKVIAPAEQKAKELMQPK